MWKDDGARRQSDAAPGVCGCLDDGTPSVGPEATGCVCGEVERVVHREKRRSVADVAKVIAFAALIVALVVGLALWL